MNVLIGDPVAITDVEAQEIRVQLFALRQKMAHVDGACSATKYADGVKESRKSKNPLRFGQSPREDCLQYDAADKADESKRLPDSGEQLGAVKVLSRPRGGVQRVQPGRERCTSKATGKE